MLTELPFEIARQLISFVQQNIDALAGLKMDGIVSPENSDKLKHILRKL